MGNHAGQCATTLAALPEKTVGDLLANAGDERFANKMRRFTRWIHQAGTEQAFYEGWMEALGYKANKTAFRALAQRVPLTTLVSSRSGAALLFGTGNLLPTVAAKSTASNLLAGLQIALSEPIRIDDVVVVKDEWGRIEEITNTYVVVKIWDERRLVVPLSFFIEEPFENWTRNRGDILGTAFLYVDYSVPVEPLRAELQRVVSQSPLWDKRVCGLQVTNLTDHAMELRCLVSSASSPQNFDLRCMVREKMIEFLQANYPQALPTLRVATTEIAQ